MHDDPSDSAQQASAQALLPGLIGNPYLIPNTNRIYANKKKLAIARDVLERYTGSHPDLFRKQIILTNFEYYLERFHTQCSDIRTKGSAMAAVHSKSADVSIVNFSIGSPTAALIIEVLASIDPKSGASP